MTEIAVPRQALASAARALARAGRWHDATALLAAAPAGDPALALAAVQVAVDSDWFAGTTSATPLLTEATRLAASLDDTGRWDLAFAGLRHEYRELMTHPSSDREPAAALLARAAGLATAAPDVTRAGWAQMYQGLITDNLLDERDTAPTHYRAALAAGAGDPLLAREALRHLGDHDHGNGDLDGALARWRRATELGAAAGNVPGTLSQQLLLAVAARDTGDEAGALALAAEVARWASALGATGLAAQATAFLDGADPTAPPPKPQAAPALAAGDASSASGASSVASTAGGGGGPVGAAPVIVPFMTAPLATTPRQ
jgi:hypothetical protein